VPEASIAPITREHGVNANQVFQWRYEYRKQTSGARTEAKAFTKDLHCDCSVNLGLAVHQV
jgi:transposase-like protein